MDGSAGTPTHPRKKSCLAADGLPGQGLGGGWLAVTEDQYHSRGPLTGMMVRELAAPRAAPSRPSRRRAARRLRVRQSSEGAGT